MGGSGKMAAAGGGGAESRKTAIIGYDEPAVDKPLTLYDKIWRDHMVHEDGGVSLIYIDRHIVHEVTSPQAFEGLKNCNRRVRRPDCTLVTVDHNVPTESREAYRSADEFIVQKDSKLQVMTLEENVKDFGLTYFGMDDARQGIVHVIGPEQGFTLPGVTMVCGDSHTSTHGAFGALAFGIGTSEVEHVMATQTLPLKKSKNMLITVNGKLMLGVNSKDVILHICGIIGTAGGTGSVIEYSGNVFREMSMEARMSVCNMTIEAGARAGMVAPDDITFEYIKGRPLAPRGSEWDKAVAYWRSLKTDSGAKFDKEVHIDADEIAPCVTWGTSPEDVVPITGNAPDPEAAGPPGSAKRNDVERALTYMGLTANMRMQDVTIQKVFIGSCTNSRIEDIRAAAAVSRGRQVAEGVHAMVVPGSGMVKKQAEAEGLSKVLIEAGFDWREAGCSMCLAMNADKLKPQERCASTSNRNFEGRQGPQGRTHLMSPAMAAAAAVTGHLTDVRDFLRRPPDKQEASPIGEPQDQVAFHKAAYTLAQESGPGEATTGDASISATEQGGAGAAAGGGGGGAGGMPKLTVLQDAIAAPMPKANIDTDMIIPKQFLKVIKRSGLGISAFFELRYEDDGVTEIPDFVLNQEPYRKSQILVAGDNFGCGSSREHAPWSMADFGFRCLISTRFADIFFNNCFKNGILCVTLPQDTVDLLMSDAEQKLKLTVDLPEQKIIRPSGEVIPFEVDQFKKHCLIHGLDDIGLTLQKESHITVFEQLRREKFSFLEAAKKQVSELVVTSKESERYYLKAARELLYGRPSSDGEPEKLPSMELIISGIGPALHRASSVAMNLVGDGDATVARVQTLLVENRADKPKIVITLTHRKPAIGAAAKAHRRASWPGVAQKKPDNGKGSLDW